MTAVTTLLLQAAMTLLLLVQGSPNIDSLLRDKAISVANQAIRTAADELVAKKLGVQETSIPRITVTYPNGGEIWRTDSTQRITWKSSSIADVKLYLYDSAISGSGSTVSITPEKTSVSAAQGYYDWKVPSMDKLPPVNCSGSTGCNTLRKSYRIQIDDATPASGYVGTVSDSSDKPFSIGILDATTY